MGNSIALSAVNSEVLCHERKVMDVQMMWGKPGTSRFPWGTGISAQVLTGFCLLEFLTENPYSGIFCAWK